VTEDLTLPEVLSLAAAADTLGCSPRTLRRAIDARELRASQLAERGCWVIQRNDLLAWLEARATPAVRAIIPAVGPPARSTVQAAGRLRRRGSQPGPLALTDDMGRAA
jgi:excisionase family DNA binding protein